MAGGRIDARLNRLAGLVGFLVVQDVLVAIALVLVIEGIWPFLNPDGFRRVLLRMATEDKGALRLAGLVSMLGGVGLLYLVN